MKKLILSISVALRYFGLSKVKDTHFVALYLNNRNNYTAVIESNLTDNVLNIEAEMLLTQTPEGPQFDEDAAREWVESLNLVLPIDSATFDEHVEDLKARGTVLVATSNAEFEALVNPIGSSLEKLNQEAEQKAMQREIDADNEVQTEFEDFLEKETEKIREIISGVKHGPNLRQRRYNALTDSAYKVHCTVMPNFGKSGEVQISNGSDILAQLGSTEYSVYFIKK